MSTKRNCRVLWVAPIGVLLLLVLLSSCVTAPPIPGSVASEGNPVPSSAATATSGDGNGATLLAESLPSIPSPGGSGEMLSIAVSQLPTPALPIGSFLPSMPQPAQSSLTAESPNHGAGFLARLLPSVEPTLAAAPKGLQPRTAAGRAPNGGASTAVPAAELPSSPAYQGTAGSATPAGGRPSQTGAANGTGSVQRSSATVTGQPSPAPVQRAPAASAGAAAPTPSAPAASNPVSAAPATPGIQGGGTTSTASGSSPAANGAAGGGKVRTVYARVGDDITIAMNGNGWTFTGGGASGSGWKSGVQYETRTSDSSGMIFVFKAKSLGSWVLEFQQQDASTGSSSSETIDLHVLTPQEFAKTIASKGRSSGTGAQGLTTGGSTGAASSGSGGLAGADWLYREGRYKEALKAYETAWTPNDPALSDKIAELAYRVGRYAVARTYWQKNFDLTGTSYGELAVAGLMKTATAQKDAPELRALFDYVHALKGVPIRSDLLATGEYLYHAQVWEVALRYLEEYLSRYDGHQGADAADFLLGEIYQGDTPMQDAQKALAYYRKIVTYYPASDYYERAKANINYLNRHFFEIR